MEKKELPKKGKGLEQKERNQEKESGKPSWISNKAFDVMKLVLGICFLPFVYSSTTAFLRQIRHIDGAAQNYFWYGVITFLVFYLFIWEIEFIYSTGHRMLEALFSFFQPLVKIGPYLLPIYSIIFFIIYLILVVFISQSRLINILMFLLGFGLILHLVFSSRSLRSKKGDLLKSNYIFGFSFIYIINLGLIALMLNIIFADFSFVSFCNNSYNTAAGIFERIFSQLFSV